MDAAVTYSPPAGSGSFRANAVSVQLGSPAQGLAQVSGCSVDV